MNTLYGTQYEEFTLNFLIKNNKYPLCYLWKDVPKIHLLRLGLIENLEQHCQDVGCDILCITKNDKYVFIQCKNYSTTGKDNSITIDDLGLFCYLILQNYDLIEEHYVYYTGKVSHKLIKLAKITKFINLPYVTFKGRDNPQNNIIIPRLYQIDAYNILKNCKRSILQMPCGTGKTFVSYLLSLDYDNVILLTPLISTTEQILDHFKNYYGNEKIIFTEVNSSTNRTPVLNFNVKNVIASTYKSCDIVNLLLNNLKNCLVIVDEFHNLSDNNLTNSNDEINKLLESNVNILFISATPKNISNNKKYFGDNKYILDWRYAIDNKYICNINTIYPNHDELTQTILDLCRVTPRLHSFYSENIALINKVLFLFNGLKDTDSKKCIVYMKSINEIDKFIVSAQLLASLLNYEIKFASIDYKTAKSNRCQIINEFKMCETIYILCNIYTLNEGIDIPACDSIFILHPKYEPINLPQRISRCNRIDFNNPNKIGHVFLWCKNKLDMMTLFDNLTKNIPVKLYESNNKNFLNLNTDNKTALIDTLTNKVCNENDKLKNVSNIVMINDSNRDKLIMEEKIEESKIKQYSRYTNKNPMMYVSKCVIKKIPKWKFRVITNANEKNIEKNLDINDKDKAINLALNYFKNKYKIISHECKLLAKINYNEKNLFLYEYQGDIFVDLNLALEILNFKNIKDKYTEYKNYAYFFLQKQNDYGGYIIKPMISETIYYKIIFSSETAFAEKNKEDIVELISQIKRSNI
jgi:superfamily II DNA or RNA helicase